MKWTVPDIWDGGTCVVVAGGPSLRDGPDVFSLPKGTWTITVNDSWRLLQRPDFSYFCDESWWTMSMQRNPQSTRLAPGTLAPMSFHDAIYRFNWVTTAPGFHEHPQVRQLGRGAQRGLSNISNTLNTGGDSGYQAINLAYLLGATRIVLLGFDMRIAPNGRTHWHDEPRAGWHAGLPGLDMLPHYDSLAAALQDEGVEVLNCTLGSALKCWPLVPLEDALLVVDNTP